MSDVMNNAHATELRAAVFSCARGGGGTRFIQDETQVSKYEIETFEGEVAECDDPVELGRKVMLAFRRSFRCRVPRSV